MTGPRASLLADGQRLHLQHGPIDLVIGANQNGRKRAFAAAIARFATVLQELVDELPVLRARPAARPPAGAVARRMRRAVLPHSKSVFCTPMAAVAGAVADEVLAAMLGAADLKRAYVNNGGDIALHLGHGASFRLAMAGLNNTDLGRIALTDNDNIGGVATSGQGGRSLSMGIAQSVTVLAKSAATADIAATLVANAVDLPGHPAIIRMPANQIDPDSDLGARPVVRHCGQLSPDEVAKALKAGARLARCMKNAGLISGAALFLQNGCETVGMPSYNSSERLSEDA